ncbi:MAG TPA: DUF3077 domain-containing protein [Pseudomonas sp.]|jgi:hypothetical protein|uniref:DUF3077 domain-containing protein n=1 Tax=Pseudomonas sp. TaxID=306 RepID=UPI002ED9FDFD
MSRPLTTTEVRFCASGEASKDQRIFEVVPGVDAKSALNSASDFLAMIKDSIDDAAMGTPLVGNHAFMVLHSLESAKAIIDALSATYQFEEMDKLR